jgi:hypothetical protein
MVLVRPYPLTGAHVASGRSIGRKYTKMSLKKALFVVMLGIITLPAIASAKPPAERHNVTPAVKSHFALLHLKSKR